MAPEKFDHYLHSIRAHFNVIVETSKGSDRNSVRFP
jgi:hypothetical protein